MTSTELSTLASAAEQAARASKAENTIRTYRWAWAAWASFAAEHRVPTLPADAAHLRMWLVEQSSRGVLVSSLRVCMAAIGYAHEAAGHLNPCHAREVRDVVTGLARQQGTRPRQQTPMLLDDLAAGVAVCAPTLGGLRDRAVLCVGWFTSFRRAEIAALAVEDITWTDAGMVVLLRRSKTDPAGAGRTVGVPHWTEDEAVCPVCALVTWLEASRIRSGPLFRPVRGELVGTTALTGHTVGAIVADTMTRAGLVGSWAGHSLRAGFVTEGVRRGASELAIMRQTGHTRVDTFRRYVREADPFAENAITAMSRARDSA